MDRWVRRPKRRGGTWQKRTAFHTEGWRGTEEGSDFGRGERQLRMAKDEVDEGVCFIKEKDSWGERDMSFWILGGVSL